MTDGKEGSKAGGNDTYNMSFIYYDTDIYDYYGKDKYNFSYAYDVDIKDYRCSDVYTLKNSYVYIVDYGVAEKVGKKMDKTLANDKYIVTHSDADITDESGNDTYKFTYSYSNGSWSDVYDKKGKDTYILKNTRVDITDLGTSSDMYTISSSSQADISDEGGADTYKVTSSQAWITDNSASKKDSYTVNALNSKVVIKDGGGAGDMLTISSASKGNLIFLADYDANSSAGDGLVHSGSLFIFDKTKGGFIDVQDFFKTGEGNKLAYGADGKATNGTGYIESVKAGKTALNSTISSYITASKLDAWAEAVSGWLNDSAHEYGSIESLVNNGTDADIKNFIAYCTQNGIK